MTKHTKRIVLFIAALLIVLPAPVVTAETVTASENPPAAAAMTPAAEATSPAAVDETTTATADETTAETETTMAAVEPAAAVKHLATAHPLFLWQARSATATVYLLGSLHAGTPELYPLDPAVDEAFESSSALVVEFDITKADPLALSQLMMSRGMYTDGKTLKESISEEAWNRLEAVLDERGMSAESFNPMRPWLVAMMMTVIEMKRHGYDEQYGVDLHFINRANEAGKEILELESGEFQINLLSGFPNELQELFLLYSLEETDRFPEMMSQMIAAWEQGRAGEIEALMGEASARDKRLEPLTTILLDERNVSMTARIVEYLKTDRTYFVVVGSGHLVGEQGIVNLLQQRGEAFCTVEQLTAKGKPKIAPIEEPVVPESAVSPAEPDAVLPPAAPDAAAPPTESTPVIPSAEPEPAVPPAVPTVES